MFAPNCPPPTVPSQAKPHLQQPLLTDNPIAHPHVPGLIGVLCSLIRVKSFRYLWKNIYGIFCEESKVPNSIYSISTFLFKKITIFMLFIWGEIWNIH